MMDRYAIKAAEAFAHAGYPEDADAILLCELDGTNEEVSEQILTVRALLKDSGATEVRTAKDDAERELMWKGRKAPSRQSAGSHRITIAWTAPFRANNWHAF